MTKKCQVCGVTKDSSKFYRDRSRKDGLERLCIACEHKKEKKRDWKGFVRRREERRKISGYYKRGKGLARKRLRDAVAGGKVKRLPCTVCASPKSEAHHHKGYSKKYWLDVVWLCRKHHGEVHKRVSPLDKETT